MVVWRGSTVLIAIGEHSVKVKNSSPKQSVGRLLAVCWPLAVDRRPTVGHLLADRFWFKYKAAFDQQSADRRPTIGDVSVSCR